ncbi:hypothetical protein AB0K09_15210 [Streptomyces sp. NPDC049577]|uniref:hypothetical protein n=1 Tax=Streptomyces sp. NPDC049577 TaxID=3155153 RepID=UPI003414E60D
MYVKILDHINNTAGAPILIQRTEDRMGLSSSEINEGLHVFYGWECGGCRQGATMPAGRRPEKKAEAAAQRDATAHAKACSAPPGRGR